MLHHLETTKKQLIGCTLLYIDRINEYTVRLRFWGGEGCDLSVEGDCCSRSIFYEIVNQPTSMSRDAVITDVVETDWDEENPEHAATHDTLEVAKAKVDALKGYGIDIDGGSDPWNRHEMKVWNVLIKTTAGTFIVRHLNASNGYYDGMTSYKMLTAEEANN